MGGEYFCSAAPYCFRRELPPRARRIRALNHSNFLCHGTTSACAENTAAAGWRGCRGGNYLRVRGEYFRLLSARSEPLELPPRARRIRGVMFATYVSDGTTSACAENTLEGWPETLSFWNYLRVRGEYNPARSTSQSEMELPPRARRIPNGALCTLKMKGTTSACAENTLNELGLL